MRFFVRLFLLLALPIAAWADTLSGTLVDNLGNRVAGAAVTVCSSPSTGIPCSPVLQTGTTASDGTWFFTIATGSYDITFVRAGIVSSKLTNVATSTIPTTVLASLIVGSLNGVLIVGPQPGQYASLQAALNNCPASGCTVFVPSTSTPFGAAGTTAVANTNPAHVIFDSGSFTYSGSATQAISNTARGFIMEGAGHRGDDIGTSGTTINITNTAVNGIANSGNGATFRDFNLIGPGSGTGKGVINTAGRFNYERMNISSWGSDGWTNDGTATNANVGVVFKVRSSVNGGNGFVTKGANGQLVDFISSDGSANTGDGWNISNQLNMFHGTNADADTGVGYHFVSGGSSNTGSIDPDSGGAILFDTGANNNFFTAVAGVGQVTDNGTGNLVYTMQGTNAFLGNTLKLQSATTGAFTVSGTASSGRLGQDSSGLFASSDTNGKSLRFLTNNGSANTWLSIPSTGGLSIPETAIVSGVTNADVCYGDSTAHALKCSYNNGSFLTVPRNTATGVAGNAVKLAANGIDLTDAGAPATGFTSVNVTPVTTSGGAVTTDQNAMAITVTAGALNSVSRTLLIQLAGVYSTPAASTATLTHKIKLCTVSGCGSGTVLTLASWTSSALGGVQATNNPYNITINSSTQTAGASAAFEVHGNLTIDVSALASAAEAIFADNNTATVGTIDSTAQLFLQHTVAFSAASASNLATDRQLIADTVD